MKWCSYTPTTSHYTDNISETRGGGGQTASVFLHAGLRNSSSKLLCTHTNSYRSTGWEWISSTTMTSCCITLRAKCLWSSTNNSSSSLSFFFFFFPPQAANPPSPALAPIQKITCSHTLPFLRMSISLMTSLLPLISCCRGKPRPRPLRHPGGSGVTSPSR